MPYDKLVDSAKLDNAITQTANAIRAKTGSADLIDWNIDTGFADAIGSMSGGNVSYQSGYRINSSGEQIAYDGYSTSDYISCELNNVVYLLNIYMASGVENAGNLRIAFYDNDKVHLGQTNATGAGDNLNGKYEATDGSLSQFTVKSFTDCDLTNVKYIRLCSTKLDGDSVVIVGEAVGGGIEKYALDDCSYLCYTGVRLDVLENFDTSKSTNFSYMCYQSKKSQSVPYFDTSNGTNFSYMFASGYGITTIPKLNMSNGTNFSYMFSGNKGITTIPELDTSKGTNFMHCCSYCDNLKSVLGLDMNKVDGSSYVSYVFYNCKNLTDLYLYNIRQPITIGSGTSYGHLLTVDSLVHTIKELCTVTSSTTLTMGSANLEKIANLYCRVLDDTTEKIEMELCESTDEGAMTLSEYASLKNWTFA